MATEEQVRAYLQGHTQGEQLANAPGDQAVYVWKDSTLVAEFAPNHDWGLVPVVDENNPSRPVMGNELWVREITGQGIRKITKFRLNEWTQIKRGFK